MSQAEFICMESVRYSPNVKSGNIMSTFSLKKKNGEEDKQRID